MNQAAVVQQAAKPADGKKPGKVEVVLTNVKMSDGRTVEFAGKRKMLKEVLIDEHKKSVSVRFDFRNGESRTFHIPSALALQFAGHGASQKIGDETAGEDDLDDMVVAVDEIMARLTKGEWTAKRATGDGFSGASIVIRALCEVTKKSTEEIKAFLQKKLDDDKAKGGTLTRAALYASFRNPASKTGPIIAKLEAEKNKGKENAVNANDLLAELK